MDDDHQDEGGKPEKSEAQVLREKLASSLGIDMLKEYTEKEALAFIGRDRKTVERWRALGKVPFIRMNGRIRYYGAMIVDIKMYGEKSADRWPDHRYGGSPPEAA